MTRGGVVPTVNGDRDEVERQLAGGELACSSCGGVLGGWGNARLRRVRVAEGPDAEMVPRRSRCRQCGATHVLLPVWCLLRRADAAAVIGAALEAGAAGDGHRKIAGLVSRPALTVRGWLRRFAGRAEEVRVVLHGAACPDRPGSGDAGRGGGAGSGGGGGDHGRGGGGGGAVAAAR